MNRVQRFFGEEETLRKRKCQQFKERKAALRRAVVEEEEQREAPKQEYVCAGGKRWSINLNIEANRRASRTKLDSFDLTKKFRDKIAALAEPLLTSKRSPARWPRSASPSRASRSSGRRRRPRPSGRP